MVLYLPRRLVMRVAPKDPVALGAVTSARARISVGWTAVAYPSLARAGRTEEWEKAAADSDPGGDAVPPKTTRLGGRAKRFCRIGGRHVCQGTNFREIVTTPGFYRIINRVAGNQHRGPKGVSRGAGGRLMGG